MNFFRNKPLIITIIIVAVLIFLMASGTNGSTITQVTSAVAGPFVPLQQLLYNVSKNTGDFFDRAFNTGSSSQEIERLKKQLDDLRLEYANYNEIKAENDRLSKMLDYKQKNTTAEFRVAQIIGKDTGNWFNAFTINLGYNDGVRENMAVITPDGLVGRVSQAGMFSSKVIAIIDGRSGASAIVERTRDVGVVKGSMGNDNANALLSMSFLPIDTDITDGDKVLSSGLDGIFPKGVLIGTVKTAKDGSTGKNITIKPAVDFSKLEEVLVVMPGDNADALSATGSTTDGANQEAEGDILTTEGSIVQQTTQPTQPSASPSQTPTQTQEQSPQPTQEEGN